MSKAVLIISILLFFNLGSSAQIDTLGQINNAFNNGEKMLDAFQNERYDEFIDYVHPEITKATGGRERLKKMFKQGLPDTKIISTTIKKADLIIVKDKTIQCSMPQKQVLEYKGKKFYTLGTLIGISYDQGKKWYFISGSGNSLSSMQQKFPEISDELPYSIQTRPIEMED